MALRSRAVLAAPNYSHEKFFRSFTTPLDLYDAESLEPPEKFAILEGTICHAEIILLLAA